MTAAHRIVDLKATLITLVLALPAAGAAASGAAGQAAALSEGVADPVSTWLEAAVHEHRLDNGWTFLLVPRPGAPVIAFETRVAAGSARTGEQLTGLTKLLERLAFKGSDRVGTRDWATERVELELVEARAGELADARRADDPDAIRAAEDAFRAANAAASALAVEGEFRRLLETAGGARSLGAEASADGTRYFVSLPANQVELWCWLEAERVERPVLRNFYREREALVRERRMRGAADPVQVALEELQLAAFRRHPYRQPTLGFAADIARQTRSDALAFLRESHERAGLVTVLVGDFEVEALKPLLERYLSAPSDSRTSAAVQIDEPPQNGERRVELNGNGPLVAIGWRVPARGHPDAPAVDAALRLLAHSRGARLAQRVVHQEPLASSLSSVHAWPGDRHEHLAVVLAHPVAGVAPAALESVIHEEVALLAETGPRPEELAGVQRVARAERMRALRDAPGLAALLAEYQLETGDWRSLTRELEQLEAVTVEQVREVLRRYFTRSKRTVVTITAPREETR